MFGCSIKPRPIPPPERGPDHCPEFADASDIWHQSCVGVAGESSFITHMSPDFDRIQIKFEFAVLKTSLVSRPDNVELNRNQVAAAAAI